MTRHFNHLFLVLKSFKFDSCSLKFDLDFLKMPKQRTVPRYKKKNKSAREMNLEKARKQRSNPQDILQVEFHIPGHPSNALEISQVESHNSEDQVLVSANDVPEVSQVNVVHQKQLKSINVSSVGVNQSGILEHQNDASELNCDKVHYDDGPPVEIVMEHVQENVSPEPPAEESVPISGMRLVDIQQLLSQINEFPHQDNCQQGKLTIKKEVSLGFRSRLHLGCSGCTGSSRIVTNREDVNELVMMTGMNAGLQWTGLSKLFRPLGCATISETQYGIIQHDIGMQLIQLALASCRHWANEEKTLSKKAGMPEVDKFQTIAAQGDSCYSKRSRGTNYSSLSGGATLIGNLTKKVIDFEVGQTYCLTCKLSKDGEAEEHECPVNFKGTASQMEPELIGRMFLRSTSFNGVVISRFIADGDSSVMPALRRLKVYLDLHIHIEKILCRLHVIRNYIK